MKNQFKPILATAILILCFIGSNAQEKYSKVKMYLPSGNAIETKRFISLQLDVDHFHQEKDYVLLELSQPQIQKLQNSNYRFDILVDDVVNDLQEQNRNRGFYSSEQNRVMFEEQGKTVATIIKTPVSFTAGSMGGYYTYAEMVTKMDNLVAAYPSIISKVNIGTTYEGRTIWGVKISDNVGTDENEAEVLYTGLQHAREGITGTSLIFFMQYLCENYATDNRVNALVNNREIFIIPCVNVDGYVYNQSTNPSGGGMWRKNRRLNSGGSYGVDLNRNYNVDWGCCTGGSATQSSDTYWGTAAFSEPETQAIRSFVTSRDFKASIDQHCYGSYYSLPFGIDGLHTLNAVDTKFYTYAPALIAKYNGHRAGNSNETVGYNVAGGIKDWFLLGDIGMGTKGKIYGWTGEAGGTGFWAPAADIIPMSKELCYQNLQVAYLVGGYAEVQDLGSLGVSTLTGTLGFEIRRIGLENKPITVTLVPLENMQSVGSPVVINSLTNYHDSYTGTISYTLPGSFTSGKHFKYVWRVETDGIVLTDTIIKFYNPVNLLNDNMEGNLTDNWSLPSGGPAANKWGFVSTSAYSGTKSLAESTAGNYPANTSRYVDYKNTFNLSDATAAYLSFWVKQRAENFHDKLQVLISTNGSTWTPIHGKTTVAEGNSTSGGSLNNEPALTGIRENWTREIFDLTTFKGSATVSLRFEFTSDATSSYAYSEDDGFYIDDVNVLKTALPMTLPVEFTKFSGKLINTKEAKLEWIAQTDNEFSHFEVEKSAEGRYFNSIGRIEKNGNYYFIDTSLFNGNNYYRIKAIDIDGRAKYTKVINISYSQNQLLVSLFPNPVKNELTIKVKTRNEEKLFIQVRDLAGRMLVSQSVFSEMNVINISKLIPQMYILAIVNNKNETLTTQKFVKL